MRTHLLLLEPDCAGVLVLCMVSSEVQELVDPSTGELGGGTVVLGARSETEVEEVGEEVFVEVALDESFDGGFRDAMRGRPLRTVDEKVG
jgi:hypothetical protein